MSRAAQMHLSAVDPALGEIIRRVGPCNITAQSDGSHFGHIMRSIVYQQLSGKAAATIFALLPAKSPTVALTCASATLTDGFVDI